MTHENEKDIDKEEIDFRAAMAFEKQQISNCEELNLPISDIIEVPFEKDTDFKIQTDRRSYLIPGPFIEHDVPFSEGNRPTAVVRPRPHRVSITETNYTKDLSQLQSLPLLTDQPFNVELNRVHLVTGQNSYSLERQNGEMNLVLDSTAPGGVQVFESLSSVSYEPIRPSDTTNSM
ncbi:Hypothetical predicted protein [Mytilus galloprovincialis]|uniref:Uncharacterized protein n=1 Tax=Mytilus galloprovincialis TaxID=29158 RepID=A0A8B6C1A6_MYTGA|nr:Hypothetical predicted protein [Mytilus galloprovincialis]